MPYIKQSERENWAYPLQNISTAMEYGVTPGDLNYIITQIVHSYVNRKGLNYTHLNDVVGVLESAKAEFQRRVVAPYEDDKIRTNGDVP